MRARVMAMLAIGMWMVPRGGRAEEPRPVEVTVEADAPAEGLWAEPGQTITVRFVARDEAGTALEGLDLILAASSGRFSPPTEAGNGRYQAQYHLPKSRHPQVVILAARAPGSPPGWTTLRLRSRTTLPVSTSKPHVMVTLSLGGRRYGPHRTDAEGNVKVPVEVVPGETEAHAVAVDEFGNRTIRNVSLPVPPSIHLLGMADKTTLTADGRDQATIYLVVIRPDGTPERETAFVAYRKHGKVGKARRLGPGLFRLRFTAPKGLVADKAKLTLASSSNPEHDRQAFLFQLVTGRPHQLVATAQPSRLFADGRSQTAVQLVVTDRGGNPIDGLSPRLSCSRGKLEQPKGMGQGVYRSVFTAPTGAEGPAICQASLDPGTPGELQAEVRIELDAPVPGDLRVESDRYTLLMGGHAQATITIQVEDGQGERLRGAPVRVRAAIGELSTVEETEPGTYRVRYNAPARSRSRWVRVFVEAGTGQDLLSDDIVINLDAPRAPEPPPPWVSIGPWAGFMTNFGRIQYAAFSLEGAVRLPFGWEHLYLAIEAGYRFGRQTSVTATSGLSVRTELEYIPLHASILFKLMPRAILTPYVGLGGGVEFVQWSLSGSDGGRERGHAALLGALAYVGGEVRVGPGAFFITARYLYAFLRDDSSHESGGLLQGSRIKGNVGGLDVGGGYRLFF